MASNSKYPKSISKYFSKLKVTDNARKANKEIREYLNKNGFKCSHTFTQYRDSYGRIKNGRIPIYATQIKTGKTIAIIVDNRTPRVVSVQKLMGCESDYKLILLRGVETNYKNGHIEVISLDIKSEDEIIEEKANTLKAHQNRQWSNASNLKTMDAKQLYDFAYSYVMEIYNEFNVIPKYRTMFNKMCDEHPVLINIIGKDRADSILRLVHKEWRQYYRQTDQFMKAEKVIIN